MDTFEKKCKVERNDVLGRYVKAAETIQAGDTILLESPVLIMSFGGDKRCANCFRLADNFCSSCHIFPLCDKCSEHNKYDCQLIAQMKKLPIDQLQQHHEICGPLKCLLLGENSETANFYDLLVQWEAHQEERRNSEIWLEVRQKIVEPLLSSGLIKQLSRFSEADEELIQRICGIIDVNCFEIRAPDTNSLRALYPRAAVFAHHCLATTTIAIDDNYQMKIYANRDISEGEMLNVCYTSPLLATDERRRLLKIGKYFHCTCERCEDPTELGSHMSSFCCSSCTTAGRHDGFHVKETNQWRCQICEHVMDNQAAETILTRVKEEIFFAKEDIRKYELLLAKLGNIFHRNHYLIIDLKQNIAAILRSIILNSACRPGRKVYERKVGLCEEIVEVLRIVQPGISRYKAIALYELYNSFAELTRLRFNENELDDAEFVDLLQQAEDMLRESLRMLLYEPVNTPEGQLARSMFKELKDLQNDMKLVKTRQMQDLLTN